MSNPSSGKSCSVPKCTSDTAKKREKNINFTSCNGLKNTKNVVECHEETFCVVSKRFRKNYIHRFTATNSFFFFSPFSRVRKACIYLSTNQFFDYLVMATILLNCVFLAMAETIEEAEYIFLAIYTAEMLVKGIAKGFILNKYTYLRNPWNWLDFVVITSGYATMGMEVGNLAGLRTFRVLRALKTISILPGNNELLKVPLKLPG
ncbi:hypothetical protein WA026_002154 [Henosepilachna vigintioctopunctata]|uniref:Ion transport domain-containing protein n=1 Tax=Henosepilachna vigintioctopunctata TaxID=420089 RepID=A0AAW1U1I5_9CUCU